MEASSEEKLQIIEMAQHEFREPLRAISGYSQLLLKDDELELKKSQTKWLTEIQEGAIRIDSLLDKLTYYTALPLRPSPPEVFEPGPIVFNAFQTVRHNFGLTEAQLQVGQVPELIGCPTDFERVLFEVFENSFKFCESSSLTITVNCHTSPERAQLEIADSGPGVPIDKQKSVFEPFVMLHSKRVFRGNGLGLAIVKELCHKNKWELLTPAAPNNQWSIRILFPSPAN